VEKSVGVRLPSFAPSYNQCAIGPNQPQDVCSQGETSQFTGAVADGKMNLKESPIANDLHARQTRSDGEIIGGQVC
jgi:hypothetical protein